jgi:hypothetical protein
MHSNPLKGVRKIGFDMLVERNSAYKKEMVVFQTKNDHFNFWLPTVDVLRNYFCGPTLAVVDTIVLAQSKVKDGFLGQINKSN